MWRVPNTGLQNHSLSPRLAWTRPTDRHLWHLALLIGNILVIRPMLTGKADAKHVTRARPRTHYFFSCFLVSSHPPSRPRGRQSLGLPPLWRLSWETCCTARRMAFCTICLLAFCSFASSGSFPGFSPRQKYEKEERRKIHFRSCDSGEIGEPRSMGCCCLPLLLCPGKHPR